MNRSVLNNICKRLAVAAIALAIGTEARGQTIFSENFDGFTAPPHHFNGSQFQSGYPVAHSGDVSGWSKIGGGVAHAVNHAPLTPTPNDFAIMFWQDNVLTLDAGIPGSNSPGQTYTVNYLASPAVYQAESQKTSAADGVLFEVLRSDNSVLASHAVMPGDWTGNLNFTPGQFQYVGEGGGDVRLRLGPSNPGSGRFGGAVDDVSVNGVAPVFSENFDGFTAPPHHFNGSQFQSGYPVAHSGDVSGWSKIGGGVAHAVNHAPLTPTPNDFAIMFWQDNVLTLEAGIPGSNTAGRPYRVDFSVSPAVYQAESQKTSAADGLSVEVLRTDGTVLASHTVMPGDWAGTMNFVPLNFQYIGDGTGDVRLRLGPSPQGAGRFAGAIDDVVVSVIPEPASFILAAWMLLLVLAPWRCKHIDRR